MLLTLMLLLSLDPVVQAGRDPEKAKREPGFGRVVKGMDVVRRIQAGGTNDREQLVVPVAIHRIYRQ